MKDIRLKLKADSLIIRSEADKELLVLTEVKIETFNHNIVLKSNANSLVLSKLMLKYHEETNNQEIIKKRNKPIHLLAENILIIIYNPIIERLELDTNQMIINIIYEDAEYYDEPFVYIRKVKIKKIIKDINERKKNLSNSN